MARTVGIGIQDFAKIITTDMFYIDKPQFIKWWESGDDVTLIARPRRFGKTLNLNMLDYFFLINIRTEVICLGIFPYGRKKSIGTCRELIR